MTIAALRSLHAIIGEAIDDIERVYAAHRESGSPCSSTPDPDPETDLHPLNSNSNSHDGDGDADVGRDEEQRADASLSDAAPDSRTPGRAAHPRVHVGVSVSMANAAHAHRHSNSNSQAYVSPPPSPSTSTSMSASMSVDAQAEMPVKKDGMEEPHRNPTIVTTGPSPPVHPVPTFSAAPAQAPATSPPRAPPRTPPAPAPAATPTPDFPSLDAPYNASSLSEALTAHPAVQAAICRIVAAAGQLAASVQVPFLTLCDASMGYHLPSCMRLMEASHVVEILREAEAEAGAGRGGMHVDDISKRNGVQASKLAHVLRLLATHHILREIAPDVFALNRISSMVDSGKSVEELRRFQENGVPEMKYRDTNGIAAFVGLCTDEIQKASAYLTETYYLSGSAQTRAGTEPGKAPFCFAFGMEKRGVGFFGWLEGQGGGREVDAADADADVGDREDGDGVEDDGVETGRGGVFPPVLLPSSNLALAADDRRSALAPEVGVGRKRRKDALAYRHTNMPAKAESTSPSTSTSTSTLTLTKVTKSAKSQLTSRGYKIPVKLGDERRSVHTNANANAMRSGSSTESESVSGVKRRNEKVDADANANDNPNRFRLERFGKAMSGTDGWEAPGAALNGFDWSSLPRGSVVVDVGGGIGSTSMLLATAFSSYSSTITASSSSYSNTRQTPGQVAEDEPEGPMLKFIIQDRPVVCEMGEKAWKAKCPELLESTARFQVHDFFTPQPITNAAVFLLRVVLHDWPDVFARKILLRLREAARPETKLVIADFVLPLACDEELAAGVGAECGGEAGGRGGGEAGGGGYGDGGEKKGGGGGGEGGGGRGLLDGIDGARTEPAPKPLLANLGKASANVYWMDLTMQVMFNSQERTLRELVLLALSAGWKIVKVTRRSGSLFGYLVAVPVDIPAQYQYADIDEKTRANPTHGDLGDMSSTAKRDDGDKEAEDDYERRYERQRRHRDKEDMEMIERASSRCGTPTFGSNTRLSSVEEALARLGGGIMHAKTMGRIVSSPSTVSSASGSGKQLPTVTPLKPALSLSSTAGVKAKVKKKPSPLSVPPLRSGSSPSPVASPPPSSRNVSFRSTLGLPGSSQTVNVQTTPPQRHMHTHSYSQSQSHLLQPPPRSPGARVITRRMSLASLKVQSTLSQSTSPLDLYHAQGTNASANPMQTLLASPQRQLLPSPLSPSYTHSSSTHSQTHADANAYTDTHAQSLQAQGGPSKMKRRASYAHLSYTHASSVSPGFFPPTTSMIPVRVQGELLQSQPPASPGSSASVSARYATPSASTSASVSIASSSSTSASASAASSIAGSPLPYSSPHSYSHSHSQMHTHVHTPLPRGAKTLGPARRASNAHLTSMFAASALSPGGGGGGGAGRVGGGGGGGGGMYRKRSGTVVVGPSISLRPGDAVVLRSAGDDGGDVDKGGTEDERSVRVCGSVRGGLNSVAFPDSSTGTGTKGSRDMMNRSLHPHPPSTP